MLRVYGCFVNQHDLRLVALAALVCAVAAFAAVSLLHHARKSAKQMCRIWLGVAGIASGFGIWATHFIAMLAFAPGLPAGYNIALTLLSLVAAILLTAAGLGLALSAALPGAAWLGGAVVGGGIATMHYTGMAAFEVAGRVIWDPALVVASIVLGAAIGGAALHAGLRDASLRSKTVGALLLTIAICSHHFTAMGAVTIVPDPLVAISAAAVHTSWLAVGVALASLVILLLAFSGLALDLRDRRRSELETDRMRGLANAAVEGLLICEGERIAAVNNSFASLVGCEPAELAGRPLASCFPDEATRLRLVEQPDQPIEAELSPRAGSAIPVEVILRPIDFAGRPHCAIAVRDLRARKQADKHIQFLAKHDALTGLPNRASFNNKLDQEIAAALGSNRLLAVLCLDLDRFKEINDLFGHAAGDELLRTVAKSVTGLLDETQMMARLGGDEFAIIIPSLASAMTAGRIAENVLQSIRAGNAGGAGALASASIGIAICPNDATDRETLMSQADTALYRAKSEGRSTYRFFEAAMGAEVRDRRRLEHDLRYAGSRHELSLVYQPQTLIETGEIVGFEALLRWRHSERGDISPRIFIPVAEESGAILQIGEWVLRTACREAARWKRPLTIAVNVSAVQLHSPDFPQLVQEILVETGLSPERLEIEITETALIRDLNRALATLLRLKALGIRIAMDDFGTGYSSLSNLRAFPFDKIKIDGSFVRAVDTNEQAGAIVRAVLGLGRGLGLPVLAEGVETQSELAFLRSELCDEAQGYLLGKPGPIEHFKEATEAVGATLPSSPARTDPAKVAQTRAA